MPALFLLNAMRHVQRGRVPIWDAPLCHRCPKNSSSVSCEALRPVWRSQLNCYWAKPRRNRGPTVSPPQAHPPTAHTHTHMDVHTYGTDLGFPPLSATVQNAPWINTWSSSAPARPVLPITEGLWRNGTVMKGSGFQMFPQPRILLFEGSIKSSVSRP